MGKLKMTTMKNYILTILTFFCSLTLFSENKLAIVNDTEGITNVYSGPGTGFKVVDTLYTDDFFYFQFVDNSEWAKVTAWKGRQIEGFIHTSRIHEVEKLNSKRQKELITKILDRQRILADNFQSVWKSKDSLGYETTRRKLEIYSETKYNPILQIIPKYYCSTNDVEIIEQFFVTIWADKGSSNEMSSFSIGDCFICNPDLIIEQLGKIKDTEQKNLILDHINWGLMNHFNHQENGDSDNKEFNELKDRIEKERNKACP
ncbi:MAG: SH3 domain-containing protein [bacterium]|nr:SH3 domain-containing protein [bacterium]